MGQRRARRRGGVNQCNHEISVARGEAKAGTYRFTGKGKHVAVAKVGTRDVGGCGEGVRISIRHPGPREVRFDA